MRAIGYVRVSTEKQAGRGVSLEAQTEKVRAMATVKDATTLEVIVDAGECGGPTAPAGLGQRQARAGLPATLAAIDLKFSDLRHEGALRKYRAGWHLNEIQRLLGHRNIQQTSTSRGPQ